MMTEEEMIFAEGFHTGLRKATDSNAGSICWNAIHLLKGEDWLTFVRTVVKGMKDGPLDQKLCLGAIDLCGANAAVNILRIGLRCMKPSEFQSVGRFYQDCIR